MIDMSQFFTVLAAGYFVLLFFVFIFILRGPTVFDRLNGLGTIGQAVIILLVFAGFLSGRVEMFVDIAITYSIIGFAGTVVIAKYLFKSKNKPHRNAFNNKDTTSEIREDLDK